MYVLRNLDLHLIGQLDTLLFSAFINVVNTSKFVG